MQQLSGRLFIVVALVLVGLAGSSAASAAPTGPPEAAADSLDISGLFRLTVGQTHACGLDVDRKVYCWGTNSSGELGTGNKSTTLLPTPVAVAGTPLDGKDIARVAAGNQFTCALTTDDVLACWGENGDGQLGIGSTTDSLVPVAVDTTGSVLDGANIVNLTSQYGHTCARTGTGAVACWGLGSVGQLANGASGNKTVPTDVDTSGTPLAGTTIAEVSAGSFNTCFVGANGVVACAGSNFQNALGNASAGNALKVQSPTTAGTVLDGKAIEHVTTGRYSTCVTTTDDVLACWGIGDDGQQGNGGTANNPVPGPVTTTGTPIASSPIVGLDSGWDHHCGRTAAGTAVCWGDNVFRQAGGTGDFLVPTALDVSGTILEGVAVTELATGVYGNCASSDDYQPACWGASQLRGDSSSGSTPTPVTVKLSYGPPTTSPTVTSLTGGAGFLEVAWDGPTGTGNLPVTDVSVRVYDGGTVVESTGSSTAPDGSGSTGVSVPAGTYRVTLQAGNASGDGPESALSSSVVVTAPPPEAEAYTAITPCRIVDTRQAGGRLADREIRDLRVTGSGSIFAAGQGGKSGGCAIPSDATAVEASITAVDPADSGFFRAWPTGESMPNATFMNFDRGMDITNTGSVTIAANSNPAAGEMRIRNFGGSSHYVIDIQGYFGGSRSISDPPATKADPKLAATYQAMTPCRIVDTRQAGGALADREIRAITVVGSGPVFAAQGGKAGGCGISPDAVAIEASVTAVDPADSGFFRAWPATESMPNATFMNFDRGMDITNTGAITIDPNDETDHLKIRNFGGRSHYVIDIQGVYVPDFRGGMDEAATAAVEPDPAAYVAITPCRIVDTRQAGGALVDREIRDVKVIGSGSAFAAQGGKSGGCGIPAEAVAVEASVTAVGPSTSGFFRAWPTGESMPNATFMNFDRGMDITNTGALTINPEGAGDRQLRIRDFGGTSHYVIDIQGYFIADAKEM